MNSIKNLKIVAAFFMLLTFASCKKESTLNVSSVTTYPELTLLGDALMLLEAGSTFTDPGAEANVGTDMVPVVVSGTVDVNTPGIYTITYSAENAEGFSAMTNRTVMVAVKGDLMNSIEGIYYSTVVRNGTASPTYTNMGPVLVTKTGTGDFHLDAIGGYYEHGRGYGPNYAGMVDVTPVDIPTNMFTYPTGFPIGAFGGSADMANMVVDPGASTVSYETTWSFGFVFETTLTQAAF